MAVTLDSFFNVISMLLSFLFLLSVLEQYKQKHRTHQLAWAIALGMFLITSGAETISNILGYWDPLTYQIYYLLAAFQVLVMGVGVLYLMSSREVINRQNSILAVVIFFGIYAMFAFFFQFVNSLLWWVLLPSIISILIYSLAYLLSYRMSGTTFTHIFVLFSLYSFLLMIYSSLISPLNYSLLASTGSAVSGQGWLHSDAIVRLFTVLFNIDGSIALIVGTFYSYLIWQISLYRKEGHVSLKNGVFNIYIALGAIILAVGGTVADFNISAILYITEVIGIALMYFGYLESDTITLHKVIAMLTLEWLRHSNTPKKNEAYHS